ncbi:MAG: thiamine-phosphate kinase [Candidatus Gastranaerophilales bacterium]|nr:thiamine-phosphate kinase [Candidatus Gastranaerophilales bacterium]
MNKEFEFLEIINKIIPNEFLGNDCACLNEYNLAISQDSLIEDVHFSLKYMTPYEIAVKSLLVNISDILASGACAKYFSIALSGNLNNFFIEEFYKGLNDVSKEYNLQLIGGDLTKSDKIMVSICVFGDYKNRKISSRYNAKNGYVLAVYGEFGSSAQGLFNLQNEIEDDYFIKIHKKPILYPEISSLIAEISEFPYAMMDSSDGLFDCLYQISLKSKVKIEFDYSKIPHKTTNKDFVLYGGEDYCLVMALDERDFKKIEGLTKIGEVKSGEGVYMNGLRLEYNGFKHFD